MYVRPRPRFRPRNAGSGNTPSLALEFNQLSALPSYVTFSRGTQAMQYGSDGTLQYAPNNLLTYSNQADNAAWTKSNSFVQTNLLTYSQEFDNVAWVKAALNTTGTPVWINAAVAPDGTATADLLIPTALSAAHSVNTVGGTVPVGTNTFSVYAKAGGYNYLQMLWGTGTDYANFNLTGAGSVSQNSGASPTITAVPGYPGWYRCTITSTFGASTNLWLMPIITGTETRYPTLTGDGVSGVYTWGAQLVQGSVPGDYRATTSAALPVLYADYNGALRARKLCEDAATASHLLLRNPITLGVPCTVSEYFKAGERSYVLFGNTEHCISVNLSTGTASSAFGSPTNITCSPAGNGYYRASFTATFATDTGYYAWVSPNGVFATRSYAGDGSSGIYIADAQLTPGYLPLAVTETTSAAVYGPRFDYDPVTKVARGLLIEEQRTNLVLYSDQFDNAAWTKTRCSVTANNATSPEGVANADKLVEDGTAASTHPVSQAVTVTAAAQTASCYLKAAERTWAQINLTGTANAFANFNLATGAIGTIGAAATATITAIANGWYRCTITSTTAAGANTFAIYPATGDNVISYNGDGVSGLYVYGAQLE